VPTFSISPKTELLFKDNWGLIEAALHRRRAQP
jgi:hypothetical protein